MISDSHVRLDTLHIENFGTLRDFDMTFERGLTVLYEENGWGKSTLAAFIRVMFYGFDGDRKRSGAGEREQFLPWQGGTFGGTLSFTAGRKPYRIERYFGRRRGDDIFRIYRADTNLETDDFGRNPGESLFGLDAESFERTIYIAQESLHSDKKGTTPAVQAQIGDLTAEAADMGNYDEAMDRLKKAASSLSPDRASGRIRKLTEELSSLEGTAARTEQIGRAAKDEDASLQENIKALDLLEEQRKDLAGSLETSALSAQYNALLTREREAKANRSRSRSRFPGKVPKLSDTDRLIRLARKIHRMQNVSPSPHPDTRTYVPAALSVLFLILTSVLFLTGHWTLAVPSAAIFLVAIAAWAALIFRERKLSAVSATHTDLQAACQELDRSLERLGYRPFFGKHLHRDTDSLSDFLLRIRDNLRELQMADKACAAARQDRESFEKSHDLPEASADSTGSPRETEKQMQALLEQSQRLRADIDAGKRKLEDLRSQVQVCREAAQKAAALREQISGLRDTYRILKLTGQYLELARENFTSQYRTPLMDSFTRYYGMIAGIFPKDFEINADLDISIRAQGAMRSSRAQSAGIRDLIALCRRMAICDAMYRGRQPFVIFDDPFVNFDDARMEGALRFLDEIAQDRQVIYLTCQSARMP